MFQYLNASHDCMITLLLPFSMNIKLYICLFCIFKEYSVQSSWKQRYMAMTPMFVETQASQSTSSQSLSPDTSMQGVRATQDVQQFSATQQQDTGNRAPLLSYPSITWYVNIQPSIS